MRLRRNPGMTLIRLNLVQKERVLQIFIGGVKQRVFKIAKTIVKTNQDIIEEQCIRNDSGVIVVKVRDKKVAWQSYYEDLLNTEYEWRKTSLSRSEPVRGVASFIDKHMVREAVRKMKYDKAARPSGIVTEMIKAAGEASIEMITALLNQIIKEGVLPADSELSTRFNCYKDKGNSLKRSNFRGLKLRDHVLKVMRGV